ncbi:MAG: SpoIIE family protein phosphatase [Brevinematales bacterium]|nr:SpoIIE family protein phosphatase [Brevinematales bacterium]
MIFISQKLTRLFLFDNIYIYFPDKDNNLTLYYKNEKKAFNYYKKINKKSLNNVYNTLKYIKLDISKEKILFLIVLYFKNPIKAIFSRKIFVFNKNKIKTFLSNIIIDTYLSKKEEKNIIEKIKDYAFIKIDKKFNITSWNSGAKYIFGYGENIIGKNFKNLIKETNLEEFFQLTEILKPVGEEKTELFIRDINKNYIKTELLIRKIEINGVILGYFLIIKDISREEIWLENLKKQVTLNKRILENTKEGIILLSSDNKIKYVNEMFNKIFGIENIFIGRDIYQILPIQYAEKIIKEVEELKKEESIKKSIDIKIYNRWYNIKFFPVKDQKNTLEEIIIFVLDNEDYMRTQEKLKEINISLINDLKTARLLQLSLIPENIPKDEEIKFEYIYEPSDEVGGDFFYIDEIKDVEEQNSYIALMADVSGHGVGSSMFTVLVKDVYNDYKEKFERSKNIDLTFYLKQLNKKIINLNIGEIKFVTVFLCLIDIKRRKIFYTSAGHPHAIYSKKDFKLTSFGIVNSPPVGIIEDYEYQRGELDIEKGEKIFIFSDGVIELFNNDLSNFEKFISENNYLTIKEIKEKIEKIIIEKKKKNNIFYIDDITMILIEFSGENNEQKS